MDRDDEEVAIDKDRRRDKCCNDILPCGEVCDALGDIKQHGVEENTEDIERADDFDNFAPNMRMMFMCLRGMFCMRMVGRLFLHYSYCREKDNILSRTNLFEIFLSKLRLSQN